ncbi:MAG: AAA family ATPase [Oscillatoriales cyanobacterium SM2_3_0]|nr:AAA family ATPase [Oscillatoriales cyanobacterium SM2_3_0]
MKLTSLRLFNFRQFYGETPQISLAAGEPHKITVIHGNNGGGKTSLLNAFIWVLYGDGKFSAAFASPEQLVNKRAIAESKGQEPVECWVKVEFEHAEKRYRMRRQCQFNQTSHSLSKSKLEIQLIEPDGRSISPPGDPEDVIGRILPVSLHQYFLFDGERIEQIVRSDKKKEIAEATKTLLGLEVISRSIRHLGEARRSLEQELKSIGSPETQKLLQQKQKLETDIEAAQTEQERIESELKHFEEIKQATSQKLRELDAVKEIQQRRENLEGQQRATQDKLKQSKTNLQVAVSTKGYTVMLTEVTTKFRALSERLRQRGELPAGIKQQFVEDLLEQGRCICGAELLPGEQPHHHVQAYKEKAGLADVEETVIRMGAQVETIDKQVPQFWQEIDQEQANIHQLRNSLSQIQRELDEIHEKLKGNPIEDIRQIENKLKEYEDKIKELNQQLGANQQKIKNSESDARQLSEEIKKLELKEEKQALTQRRIAATGDAIERLKDVQNRIDKVFRVELEKRIQEIFGKIIVAPYRPKLTEKYELTLVEATTGPDSPVAASTGENQVLSLSFICAIIDRVREWSEDQSGLLMGPDSGTFPMVMDSPFGSLDEIYRRRVAQSLPTLANQLVILASKTQWRGEVEAEMRSHIGQEYVLVYNSPKLEESEGDQIELSGQSYPLVRLSPNEFEYTEILEVS